jgi:hypothetical protein
MHKQSVVFTFGLLASSLVMLAVMPLFNNNVSNIVMAQEYDKYRDSYYTQFPTDDNKYQCRTGPFEGFFVSSVEFCKHLKFDKDRKDHSIDNKTGAPGPQGPQGPPGITQLNDTNTYSVNSGEIVNTFNSSTVGVASCNSGDFVINGGFTITGTSPSPAGVTLFEDWNKPFYSPVTSGWEVFIFPTTSSGKVIYLVHATCFDNSP